MDREARAANADLRREIGTLRAQLSICQKELAEAKETARGCERRMFRYGEELKIAGALTE